MGGEAANTCDFFETAVSLWYTIRRITVVFKSLMPVALCVRNLLIAVGPQARCVLWVGVVGIKDFPHRDQANGRYSIFGR